MGGLSRIHQNRRNVKKNGTKPPCIGFLGEMWDETLKRKAARRVNPGGFGCLSHGSGMGILVTRQDRQYNGDGTRKADEISQKPHISERHIRAMRGGGMVLDKGDMG